MNKYNKDLSKAIVAQFNSPLGYGSEFRPTNTLEVIFSRHPNWTRMKNILENGSAWPLEELEESKRETDMKEALSFGNHKGAVRNPILLRKLIDKDVVHGYGLVLPLSKIDLIPGVLLATMNIMTQNTIEEHRIILEKDKLTHNQSYKSGSGTSVSSRVDKDNLLPCRFGASFNRLMNWTVAARKQFTGKKILSLKN